MHWDVVEVWVKGKRDLGVRFADGVEGTVTIAASFCSGVFEPLRDDALVAQAGTVDGVMTWPNGLDLAPDTMYREIKSSAAGHYVVGNSIRLAARSAGEVAPSSRTELPIS